MPELYCNNIQPIDLIFENRYSSASSFWPPWSSLSHRDIANNISNRNSITSHGSKRRLHLIPRLAGNQRDPPLIFLKDNFSNNTKHQARLSNSTERQAHLSNSMERQARLSNNTVRQARLSNNMEHQTCLSNNTEHLTRLSNNTEHQVYLSKNTEHQAHLGNNTKHQAYLSNNTEHHPILNVNTGNQKSLQLRLRFLTLPKRKKYLPFRASLNLR